MINWINSWRGGNKKQKFEISFRLGKLTVLEAKASVFLIQTQVTLATEFAINCDAEPVATLILALETPASLYTTV